MKIIELVNASKSFKEQQAVQDVSFSIGKGEIVSILGPNGAGKTTTMLMMLGLLDSSKGEVKVFGESPKSQHVKKKVGAMLQEVSVLDGLTVLEVINLFRSYYPNPLPAEELLSLSDLKDVQKRRTEKLSGGQKRRLSFALAMAGDPELLFMDEPTVGMDTVSRRKFWETIKKLSREGKTIIFTTHYLQEADDFSSRIILFKNGSIAAEGTPEEIKLMLSKKSLSFLSGTREAAEKIGSLPFVQSVSKSGSRYTAETEETDAVLAYLFKENLQVKDIRIEQGRLEEAFERLIMENKEGDRTNESFPNAMHG